MRKIIYGILVLMLSACTAQTAAEPRLSNTPAPLPSQTSIPPTATPQPTNTPTPTDTPAPTETPDPLVFRDDFEGVLDEGWQWTHEVSRDWSLTNNPGWLEIMAGHGKIRTGSVENLLLRPGPDGNFVLETRLNFRPGGDYQFAGLVVYESGANHIVFGRVFDSVSEAGGDLLYMLLVSNGNVSPLNFSTTAPDVDTIYLRLRFKNGYFTGYFSEDGIDWQVIGSQYCDTIEPIGVGVVAGWASGSVPQPAQFDYFLINSID